MCQNWIKNIKILILVSWSFPNFRNRDIISKNNIIAEYSPSIAWWGVGQRPAHRHEPLNSNGAARLLGHLLVARAPCAWWGVPSTIAGQADARYSAIFLIVNRLIRRSDWLKIQQRFVLHLCYLVLSLLRFGIPLYLQYLSIDSTKDTD